MAFSEFRMQKDVCLSEQLVGSLPIYHSISKKPPGIISSLYTNKKDLLDMDRFTHGRKATFASSAGEHGLADPR